MPELVDTYDWYKWAPEIIVGYNDASEDMAVTYARRAAREFAIKTRVLKRVIAIRLQPGIYRYPLEPFEDEDVQGVVSIESSMGMCACESCQHGINIGIVSVNVARQELHIQPNQGSCGCHMGSGDRGPKDILVTVWSAPTEESCKHDVFLWNQYRREITLGARADYISEALAQGSYKTTRGYSSFRGDQVTYNRADKLKAEFMVAMRKARVAADTENAIDIKQPGSPFATGCCAPRGWR